jgi:SAM-dependent methyltransferase
MLIMSSVGHDFVPRGAHRWWPFRISADGAYCVPPRYARVFLWQGTAEALLGAQPIAQRQLWHHLPRERLITLMHTEGAGAEHPSRVFVASLVREDESVLDVGCGAGAGYEALAAAGRARRYVGVDSSAPSIAAARELYPAGDFRVADATALTPTWSERSVDVVLVRHVLEHLPDFEAPMAQAITVSRRLAIFVFFLTPRRLPFGVRKIDPGFNRPFYTYIYSRPAIERFLAGVGATWRWHDDVGVSRAGWLAHEHNSVLIVSLPPA